MIKLASRRVAIVLAGSVLAVAGGLGPAQAATTGWRIDEIFALRGSISILTSVTASGPSDAWATGFSTKPKGTSLETVIRHWTGHNWRQVTLPSKIAREWAKQDPVITQVGASSAGSVWVFSGIMGRYLRLDGSHWSLRRLPGVGGKSAALVEIAAVKVFSGADVWAFGKRISFSRTQIVSEPYAAHFDGRNWSRMTVPGLASGNGAITAVAAVSSDDMWAVESAQSVLSLSSSTAISPSAMSPSAMSSAATPPVVLQWTARTGWQDAAQQPHLHTSDQLISAAAEPDGDVWFGGSAKNKAKGTTPLGAEWNGTRWSVKDLPMRATSAKWQLSAMTPDGTGGIWALAPAGNRGTERIWHRHGAIWSQVRPAFGRHRWLLAALALVPRTHSVWAVGAVPSSKLTARNLTANGLIAVYGPLPR